MEKALSRPPLTLSNAVESKALTRKTKGDASVDKQKVVSWLEQNMKAMKPATSYIEGKIDGFNIMLREVETGAFDPDPVPTLSPGDNVTHVRFGGPPGKVVKIAKSGKRAYVKWPNCVPAYYEMKNLLKVSDIESTAMLSEAEADHDPSNI